MIPLLTAEEDRDLVRRHLADQAREKELLGSETSPYNSDRYVELLSEMGMEEDANIKCRYVRPTYAITPNAVSK